jgi:hypothetical protein
MHKLRLLTVMLGLFVSLPATAATIRVANNCTGVTAPCTTSLQSALDNSAYSHVDLVANAVFSGEFMIERSLVLTGDTGSVIQRAGGSIYALRIESTSGVEVLTTEIYGRIAVYDSVEVDIDTCIIASGDSAIQILDSDDVQVRSSVVEADDRAIDITDSTAVVINGGDIDGVNYGIVVSSSVATFTLATIYGAERSVVIQKSGVNAYPSVLANGGSITTVAGRDPVWRWVRGTVTFQNFSPNPTQYVSSNPSQLVSPLSFTPQQGD